MISQQDLGLCSTLIEKTIPYNDRLAPLFIRNTLYSLIPAGTEHVFVLGIGSNEISGDSLGPFVGTLLTGLYRDHLTVLGNLQYPLDATTLFPVFSQTSFPNNSFIIAIDSVLGIKSSLESIVVRGGSLLPGLGLDKILPPVGDCSIMGVVVEDNSSRETSLFSTNLHLIYTMANQIAKGISLAIRQYYHYPSDRPIL